ncbi:MAG: FG-GAP-like repeat-containing protein [Bacteroidales bacterium]
MRKTLFAITLMLISVLAQAQVPRILWWFDTDDSSFGQSALDDIDQDGKYEVVFGCYRNDSMIYALNAEDGSLLWKFNASGAGEGCNDVAILIYDVTGDDIPDVIVPSSCNPKTFCFRGHDGFIQWQTNTRGSDSPPVVVDIDKDGNLEILHGEFQGWVRCMDGLTGVTKWELLVDANSWVQTAPTIADVDQDGQLDFVVATWGFNNNSRLYAYDGATRALHWSIPMDDYVYHGTGVADLDGDGKPELVVGDYSGKLHVLNAEDGTYAWSYNAGYYIGAPPAIGDINGDGQCEVVITSYFKVIALTNQGGVLWQYNIPGNGQAFRGVALADITNDTIPEVIFGSSNGSVYALNGFNGNSLWSVDLKAHIGVDFEIDHAPVIADFNGDDTLDLFIVGGFTEYPNFQANYGRGYALAIGKGAGPEWKMFQRDYYRSCSQCYPGQIIGVEKSDPFPLKPQFSIHPVPVYKNGNLHIQSDTPGDYTVQVFDLSGKLLYTGRNVSVINTAQISLEAGMYLIRCQSSSGSSIKKFAVVTP